MAKQSKSGEDRRRQARMDLTTCCPTHIRCGGTEQEALMVDLSGRGAGLRLEGKDEVEVPVPGAELDLEVATPYGDSACRAQVAWVAEEAGEVRMGVEFTELDEALDDPLRALIDSPF